MLTRTTIDHRGYTLMELIVVMAILILLATIILPSIYAFRGDSRPRAGADIIRAELAHARALAMDEGTPYRVALSNDGKRIRRGPATDEFATATADTRPTATARLVEYAFDNATARVVAEEGTAESGESDGYTTIAIVLPNGSCLDENVIVAVTDEDGQTVHIRIRGLTGASRVVPNPNANTTSSANANGGMR